MNLRAALALLLLCAAPLGCGDDGASKPAADAGPSFDAGLRTIDLIGQWAASSHVYTNNADSQEFIDLIANGGTNTMTVLAGGRARTFRSFNEVSDNFDSMLLITGEVLRFTTDESPPRVWNWSFSLVGNTLTLDEANQSFDFTQSGSAGVSASEHIVFERL